MTYSYALIPRLMIAMMVEIRIVIVVNNTVIIIVTMNGTTIRFVMELMVPF